jgi:ParB-like chromosome segregation protein Spo0J
MTITINSKIDSKKFPLQGIGEYFEKVGKLPHAKHAYRKVLKSPLATEIDKANARMSIKKVDEKLRTKQEGEVDVTAVVNLPTSSLSPHPEAKMEMGSQDYKRLKDDIAENGIRVPLLVDTSNQIVCGAHRWRVAKELDIKEVPCFVAGITSTKDIKKYSISDNLCRRQLSTKEKKAWIVELLRLREIGKESIRGRKKGGPRKPEDQSSNRQIAEIVGVSPDTVDRTERDLTRTARIRQLAKKANVVREDFKESITKGKSHSRDKSFPSEVAEKVQERVEWIVGQMEEKDRLTVKVEFEYTDRP